MNSKKSQIKGLTDLIKSYRIRAENMKVNKRGCGSVDYRRAEIDTLEMVYHDLEELLK